MTKVLFCIVFFLFPGNPLYANMYFWTDEAGIKHFTNITPPPDEVVEEFAESHRVFEELTSDDTAHYPFKVLKVFDGDTIKVSAMDLVFTIRLAGIDSPEIGYKNQKSQPYSRKAKAYLESLVDNRMIALKGYGSGGYNRQLAEVFVEGKNVNIEMIKQGLAEVYRGSRPKSLDSGLYLKEETMAKKAGKGMWQLGKAYKSPKQWRRENPRR